MYFNKPGLENTQETINLVLKTARERGIKNIVVASNTGYSAQLLKNNPDLNITCVTHAYGYPISGENEMSDDIRKDFEENGIKVLSTTHVLSGAERALSKKFGGISPVEIMAYALRMFGQGLKVCVEVSVMAADSGFIPYLEPIIAIGGTGRGADTAIIISAAHASNILDTKIHEIICKPL
ncbi:MAG: pyruvate kinase alpha/beta domain-containing protein [Clostridiaceae bacterium]